MVAQYENDHPSEYFLPVSRRFKDAWKHESESPNVVKVYKVEESRQSVNFVSPSCVKLKLPKVEDESWSMDN